MAELTFCVYCFEPATEWDHVIPRGQPDSMCACKPGRGQSWRKCADRVPVCRSCNLDKSNRTPEEWFTGITSPMARPKDNKWRSPEFRARMSAIVRLAWANGTRK